MNPLRWLLAMTLALGAGAAAAMSAKDGGVFVALDDEGRPAQKILRVSKTERGWRFEDRQPDDTWLDVSCHGGCEHKVSTPEEILGFFGSPPPPSIRPDCIHNEQYAFCRFVPANDSMEIHGYVLVVKAPGGNGWHPINLIRVQDPDAGKPALEAAVLR